LERSIELAIFAAKPKPSAPQAMASSVPERRISMALVTRECCLAHRAEVISQCVFTIGVARSIAEQDRVRMQLCSERGKVARHKSLGTPRNSADRGLASFGPPLVSAIKHQSAVVCLGSMASCKSPNVDWAERCIPRNRDYAY
jgi:hypothetical protein